MARRTGQIDLFADVAAGAKIKKSDDAILAENLGLLRGWGKVLKCGLHRRLGEHGKAILAHPWPSRL